MGNACCQQNEDTKEVANWEPNTSQQVSIDLGAVQLHSLPHVPDGRSSSRSQLSQLSAFPSPAKTLPREGDGGSSGEPSGEVSYHESQAGSSASGSAPDALAAVAAAVAPTFDPNKTFRGLLKLQVSQATLTRSFIDKSIQ